MSRIQGWYEAGGRIVTRWLDPTTGCMYVSEGGTDRAVGDTFNAQPDGSWRSSLYVWHPLPVAPAPQPMAGGLKFDGDKPRPTLLMQGCPNALAGVIGVLGFGAKKYAADSWKQVENGKTRYRDALYRHLAAVEAGEVNDPESGLPHWHHICCNALFLAELNHEA